MRMQIGIAAALIVTACVYVATAQEKQSATTPKPPSNEAVRWQEARIRDRTASQQKSIQALVKRGRFDEYQKLYAILTPQTGTGSSSSGPVDQTSITAQQKVIIKNINRRESAIDLAARGFTAADVVEYRKRGIDLLDVYKRLGGGSIEDYLILSDTVMVGEVIGDTHKTRDVRRDGFLSAVSFKVMKPLKGQLVKGDVVHLPQRSGVLPNGLIQYVTSEIHPSIGQQYLLVLSKNRYEQWVVEDGNQLQPGYNALRSTALEVASNGSDLLPYPSFIRLGGTPKNIQAVEATLERLPQKKN